MLFRMIVMLCLVTTMWGGLHAYVWARLLPAVEGLGLPAAPALAFMGLSFVLAPSTFVLLRMSGNRLADGVQWVGYTTMGLFSLVFAGVAFTDGLKLLAWGLGSAAQAAGVQGGLPDSALSVVGPGVVVALALVLGLVGLVQASRPATVMRVRIPIEGLDPKLEGFTIAQISDVHVGPTVRRPRVQQIVDQVNALGADLVAVTGDLVDGSVPGLAEHVEPLRGLRSRHGSWFVTGNHEYYSGALQWIDKVQELGMTSLTNAHRVLEHDGAEFIVAGVPDLTAHSFVPEHRSDPALALKGAPASTLKLLLAHQPRSAGPAQAAGFDLMLCGHTHGGQFVPWTWLIHLGQPYVAGLDRLEQLWVYVNRGTTWWGPPMRLGAPQEITLVELVAG